LSLYTRVMTGGQKQVSSIDGVARPQGPAAAPDAVPTKDDILLSWEAPSFERKAKDYRWYLAALGVILAIIGYSIWQQDWFFIGIVIIVSAVAFWYLKTTKPQRKQYAITPLGIISGDHVYPFSEIHSFWVVYRPNVKILCLAFTRKYLPTLEVSLGNMDPVVLRSVLSKRIPEQSKRDENIVDKLVRVLGF